MAALASDDGSSGATIDVYDDAGLHAAVAAAVDGDVIVIRSNITLESRIYVWEKEITITGDGIDRVIIRDAGFNHATDAARGDFNPGMIEVASGSVSTKKASLTLLDVTLDDNYNPLAPYPDQIPIDIGPTVGWEDHVYDSVISAYTGNATVTLGEGAAIINVGGASAIRMTGGILNLEPGSYVEGSNASHKGAGSLYGAIWLQGAAVLNFDATLDGADIVAPYIYTDYPATINFNGKVVDCDVKRPLLLCRVGGYAVHLAAGSEITGNTFTNTRMLDFQGSGYVARLDGGIDGNSFANSPGVHVQGDDALVELNGSINGNATTGNEVSFIVVSGWGIEAHLTGEIVGNTIGGSVMYVGGGNNTVTLHAGSVTSGNTVDIAAFRQYNTASSHFDIYGEVSGNESTANNNGGAFYLSMGTATVHDGARITGNTAYGSGGGFFLNQGATLTMLGGEISGNVAKCLRAADTNGGYAGGGGVSITSSMNSGSTFVMKGGVVTGNHSATTGGGVLVTGRQGSPYTQAGHAFVMEGGSVTGNTAGTAAGADVAVGGPISGGRTSSLAGGFYASFDAGASIGDGPVGASIYNTSDYDKTGVYLLDRAATVRLGNISDALKASVAGGVSTLPAYAGYTERNGVWYSIDRTAGVSALVITYPPGIGDPDGYEWVVAAQPLAA
ncbi:MAG: hypothetical protein FWH47_08015, partial [Methanomassiliicoccaceae archaeon]|nr:hypothetical protein [Methanomassiliicoccaceae archaeon]